MSRAVSRDYDSVLLIVDERISLPAQSCARDVYGLYATREPFSSGSTASLGARHAHTATGIGADLNTQ